MFSNACILLDMMKGNISNSKVCASFENLFHTHSEKETSFLAYFCQKFPVNGKIVRKSLYLSNNGKIMTGKRQNLCLFFKENISIKHYREQLLAIIYCERKMSKIMI